MDVDDLDEKPSLHGRVLIVVTVVLLVMTLIGVLFLDPDAALLSGRG